MNSLEHIRKKEKEYHDFCYENYRLFEKGSWLYKPVQTVMSLLLLLENEILSVLDLGSGVGRNSIPIAEAIKNKNGKVHCVDILDSALEKLDQYRKEFHVENIIELYKSDIGDYQIQKNKYDLIVAVSSLEHVSSETIFESVVERMAAGTKSGGINCLIVNSDVQETDMETNEKLAALMEINIPTNEVIEKLNRVYRDWDILEQVVKPLEYQITRDAKTVLLRTNAITYVVRKVITASTEIL
ncbi:class I SAM-dependent methyltransferase [Robertmurraya kyonggiensis]|uniref:Class I SAM-dependent methyltransferase n=1 Tax=Robertmurraya kyonggiensis TaxID=1037680 RepID=A0A4U1D184_9BACI|nr:class I SAM-dependent methyltransferase [Robertmurraya kyonggiensis]TKC14917.1 class I SAM-dependent methyltransferase [Robertmurraya kyonggiensis]